MSVGPEAIVLRAVEDRDMDVFFANQSDPEANEMAAFTAKDPSDRSAFDTHWARIRVTASVLIRTIEVSDVVVGSVLSYVMEDTPEVSYWIGREHWGQGIATVALEKFLKLQTTRPLIARVAKDNRGSVRVLEKCGFRITGEDKGFAHGRGEEVEEFVLQLD